LRVMLYHYIGPPHRCTGGHTLCSTEVSREPAVLSRHAATT